MTEQEINQYLKNNKKEGRIYRFMPEEVRKWCSSHIKDLLYFDSFYKQFLFINHNIITHNICEDDIVMDVVALSDNYNKQVPIINLKLNINELNIIKNELEEGLDLNLFEKKNDIESIFAILDKINALIH